MNNRTKAEELLKQIENLNVVLPFSIEIKKSYLNIKVKKTNTLRYETARCAMSIYKGDGHYDIVFPDEKYYFILSQKEYLVYKTILDKKFNELIKLKMNLKQLRKESENEME